MNESLSQLVQPVLAYGLALRRQLSEDAHLNLDFEQARLRELLLSYDEAERYTGFGSEMGTLAHTKVDGFETDRRRMSSSFLGIRYALVCWLDEIMTTDLKPESRWGQLWTESKLESQLYASNDRAWKFWEQAKLAQAQPGEDLLECFYLCVSLGFRGELRDQPDKLRSWCNQAKLRLGKVAELQFPYVTETNHIVDAPPLYGESMFRKMTAICWLAILLVIPLISIALINRLGS